MRTKKISLLNSILFLLQCYEEEIVWQTHNGNHAEAEAAKRGRHRMLRHLSKYVAGMTVYVHDRR